METLKAYMRYHLLSTFASKLPKRFDEENFDFFGRILNGQPDQQPRWKRCSNSVNGALGEALGKVYVEQYFAGDSKTKMLEMVGDIEGAMDRDIDSLDWMSAPTKVRAKEKLHLVANKIGYPDKFRDYSSVDVKPDDALGDERRATEFENDRQLAKIGKPVDHSEWGMTPPTVNAYYNPSMNDINFPAGILQPSFYDPKADDAINYGHIGAVIGHELTHGFDDEGKKFDGHGNLSDWWSAEDTKQFQARTDCVVNEYGGFTAVDDLKVNGKLTLGENTADNGGLVLAYMAYLERAKLNKIDLAAKVDGYTSPPTLLHRLRAELVRERPPGAGPHPGPAGSPLPGSLPRQRSHRQPARLRRRLRLQTRHPHGPRQQLPRLVAPSNRRPPMRSCTGGPSQWMAGVNGTKLR